MNSTRIDDFLEGNKTCDWNLVTFGKDQEKEKIEFIDPYDSIWLKLITVHGSYERIIMLETCGRLDLTVFHLI